MVGPMAGAKVTASAKIASPIGCCDFGSLVSTSVKAIGIRIPPAKPCNPRMTIIEPRSCVNAQAMENSGNSTALTRI